MSKKQVPVVNRGKPVRFTKANRIQVVNNIIRVLFSDKVDQLCADMQTRADLIERRVHAAYFDALGNVAMAPYVSALKSNDKTFHYEKTNGSDVYRVPLIAPRLHFSANFVDTFAQLGTQDAYANNPDSGNKIKITGPKNSYHETSFSCPLSANEARAISALERRVADLKANFDAVRQQLVSAVAAHKTIAEFYEQFPEFEKVAGVEAYDIPASFSTALVPARASVMDVLRSAGVLPALRAASAEPVSA